MRTLLKLSVLFMISGLIYLGFSYVKINGKALANVPNTFLASVSSITQKENETNLANLQAKYLNDLQGAKTMADFTEKTIDKNGFYLRIDKINLFKAIVKDVDPRYKDEYVKSWEKGVSHGKFTATPDQIGITYLFAHAVSDKTTAVDKNAWFSNLDQLTYGDKIIVYYNGVKYTYEVSEIRVVSPDATGFYTGVSPVPKVRLQYCGPPTGSLDKRTLIDGLLSEETSL